MIDEQLAEIRELGPIAPVAPAKTAAVGRRSIN